MHSRRSRRQTFLGERGSEVRGGSPNTVGRLGCVTTGRFGGAPPPVVRIPVLAGPSDGPVVASPRSDDRSCARAVFSEGREEAREDVVGGLDFRRADSVAELVGPRSLCGLDLRQRTCARG